MAAKKKKAKKTAARKARKAPARKATAKKASKRPAKKAVAKRASKTATKASARKGGKASAKKAKPAKKKTQIVGEGDYAASRAFLKDQAGFVEKNKAKIPAMGREAEEALEGPAGNDLRTAEATAAARSRDTF